MGLILVTEDLKSWVNDGPRPRTEVRVHEDVERSTRWAGHARPRPGWWRHESRSGNGHPYLRRRAWAASVARMALPVSVYEQAARRVGVQARRRARTHSA